MSAPAALSSAALTSVECETLFAPLGAFSHVLLAVSGGVDSTVLLYEVCAWAQEQITRREQEGRAPLRISVACVDHGLRADSMAEALSVKSQAQVLGCAAEILSWVGDKPATRLQETAREKRYDLLSNHARQIGAEAIVIAHHADDQAETILMRMAAGSGPEGLGGMRPHSQRDGLSVLRPFLTVPKAVLYATARHHGWHWHEDPSNLSERFERVRLRKIDALRASAGLTSKRLGRLAERLARQQEAIDVMVGDCWSRLVKLEKTQILIKSEFWACPAEIRLRLLAKAIQYQCADAVLRLERLETFEANLHRRQQAGQKGRRTLGGSMITLAGDGRLILTAEPARRSLRQKEG